MHAEKDQKQSVAKTEKPGAIPPYLEDRQNVERAKVCVFMCCF